MLTSNKKPNYLSIYVHWPFCHAKCPYCDFNSHVRTNIDQTEWTKAYIKSLKFWKENLPEFVVDTIFFGGGTPSLMKDRTVYEILQNIHNLWKITPEVEITLEANPTSTEKETFSSYRCSGVNRLSLGVQAFHDADLKRLGRLHNSKEAKEAIGVATNIFKRVSFDLIYGRQYQTLSNWEKELQTAIEFSTEHLSLYQLTIEKGTRFGDLLSKNKLRGLPNDVRSRNFYINTQDICEASGLQAYEISNHAIFGKECRHNINYWNSGCFLGIGPGAHGRLNIGLERFRTEAPKIPEVWLDAINKNDIKFFIKEPLTFTERAEEYAIASIRLRSGMDMKIFQELSGTNISANTLSLLLSNDFITIDGNKLKTTSKGKLMTDQILREILC